MPDADLQPLHPRRINLYSRLERHSQIEERPLFRHGQGARARVPLHPDQIERIARTTGDGPPVVELVDALGDAITPTRSLAVLVATGGPYAQLATPGAEVTLPIIGGYRAVADRLKLAGPLTKVSVKRTKPELIVTVA